MSRLVGFLNSVFRDLHATATTRPASVSVYMCVSRGSRAVAWRKWKDWEGWPDPGSDGPLHDNKKFITRYGNGSTVQLRVHGRSL